MIRINYQTTTYPEVQSDEESGGIEKTTNNNDKYLGDTLTEKKEEGTTRIYFQNLNGLKWDKEGGIWPMVCQNMASIQTDIMGFVEVNQDTSKYEVSHQLEKTAKRFFGHQRIIAGTSNRTVRRTFKPGGTMMMTVENAVKCARDTTRDRMGRWVSTRYSSTSNNRTTVIMAYQVCQTKRTGNNTAVNQQMNMILEESVRLDVIHRTNPREAFIVDLCSFVQHRQSEGDQIILFGDFNETVTEARSGVSRMMTACNLMDVMGVRLGTTEKPGTYKRSTRRIDYVLISPELYQEVKNVGYEPFDYRGIQSDHRGMFMDISTEALFGETPAHLAPHKFRDFSAENPDKVVKYIERKYSELNKHNIEARLTHLERLTEPDHNFAERLDKDMTRASKIAEKSVRRKYQTPWSPIMAKAWALIHLYKTVLSQHKNPQINNWATIHTWQKRYEGMPTELPTTLQETQTKLKEAYQNLRKVRQQAEAHRQAHLETKAMLYATLEHRNKEKIIRQIQRAEDMKTCYNKLRYLRRDTETAGISELQIPKDPTMDPKKCPQDQKYWNTVKVPTAIQQLLIDRNRKHFGQSHGTPLTDKDFVAEVKYDGSGTATDLILEGTYDASDLDKVSRLFIKHMTQQTTTELPSEITKEEFIGKLKIWPEKTSTSPSGIHLGHYKALWQRHNITSNDNPDAIKQFENKRDLIIRIHLALLNYSVKFGYSYQRWHKVVNIMLRKDPHNSYIHRLRIIHLYEADYNLLLSVKWRQAIHHAEDHHLLNEGLYGSRPGRTAHDPVFLEIMQTETYRTSMKSGINKDLDATSCYDRILTWVASICSRRVGINRTVAIVNSRTLEKARYHLKTDLQVSEESYQHCDAYPIYGTGQGSGNSPQLWCFVVSTLFDAFTEKAHGASFHSYDGKHKLQIYMTGFVDDCSQRVNDFQAHPQPNAQQLVNMMKKDAQLWNDLLWASGGALEIPKCSFQLIETDWTIRGHPFLRGQAKAPPLIISSDTGHFAVKHISNYEARRSLGVYLSPSGTMNKQFKTLLKKSKQFAELVMTNAITRRDANIMFHGIYIPAMTYPLALTSLTRGQCQAIETPFINAIVPRCGYNRTMSRAIRYAPKRYGGAGFLSLHVEQAVQTILMAIKHLRCPQRQTGQMEMIAITWAQAYAGVSWSLWEYPDKKIPKIPTPWINHVRCTLSTMGAKIKIAEPHVQSKLRENDWFIMDIAIESNKFDNSEIDDINAYRRFYQATTAADITDDLGVRIRAEVWKGTGDPKPEDYVVEFFNQPRPNEQACRTWRKFLRHVANTNRYLKQPLKKWTVTHEKCRKRPKWVYEPKNKKLYYCTKGNQYSECLQQGDRYIKPEHQTHQIQTTSPSGYPVAVLELGQEILVRRCYEELPETNSLQLTFPEYLQTLEEWEKQLIKDVELHGSPETTVQSINDGAVLYIASDGSVIEHNHGSYGFTITHVQSRKTLVTGKGPVPGHKPSSFRAESYGALAAGRLLVRLAEYTGIDINQEVRHWLDNQSVIKRIHQALQNTHQRPNSTLQPEWDVIHEIAQTFQSLKGVSYKAQWIKSHQDSGIEPSKLTLAAQMNCTADKLATQFHTTETKNNTKKIVPMMPHTKAQIEIQGKTITSQYKTTLRQALTLPPYLQYLKHRFQWKDTTSTIVDWDIMSMIIAPYDSQRPTLVKHLHNIAPTGKYIHRNNHHAPRGCPACPCEDETNDHMLICPAESRHKWRIKVMQKLQRDRSKQRVDGQAWDILVEGIQGVLSGNTNGISTRHYDEKYHTLIHQQNEIGWCQAFKGRWAIEWRQSYIQGDTMHQQRPTQHDAMIWVKERGRTLLAQWWDLWKIRNEEQHGKETGQQTQYTQKVVQSQMEEIYSYKNKVMRVDHNIYPYSTAKEHMESSTNMESLQDWCLENRPAIMASCSQAEKQGIAGTGDIRLMMKEAERRSDSTTIGER